MDNFNNGFNENEGQEFLEALDRFIIAGFDFVVDLQTEEYNALVKDWINSKDYTNLISWESLMQLESSSATQSKFEDRKDLAANYALAKQSAGQELYRLYIKHKNSKKHGKK